MPTRRAAKPAVVKNEKCACNPAWLIAAWILGALGIWSLVGGSATQFASSAPTAVNYTVLGWYFVGLLLVKLAKMCKHKSCGCCGMHDKC